MKRRTFKGKDTASYLISASTVEFNSETLLSTNLACISRRSLLFRESLGFYDPKSLGATRNACLRWLHKSSDKPSQLFL
ncbi:hypothetical protein AC249_AIPGENE4194 [Exaiptasia diaphana]|nr:hypothetical protein AC249_AIPGENE4194 [Exaiptasia diaphana]